MVYPSKGIAIGGICLVTAATFGLAPPAQGGVQFFFDQLSFDEALADVGKAMKGSWNFKPDNLLPGASIQIPTGLHIGSHADIAPGVWDNPDGSTFWPDEIDNVVFLTNSNPTGAYLPGGNLLYTKGPSIPFTLNNNLLSTASGTESLFVFGAGPGVVGPEHTAMGFELATLFGAFIPPSYVVTAFGADATTPLGTATFGGFADKSFIGILATDGDLIGAVDVFDQAGGTAGITSISLFVPAPGAMTLLALAGVVGPRRRRRS